MMFVTNLFIRMRFALVIDGFQSYDRVVMLVHKTIAKYGSCFA